jgi:hypothetical protein
MKLPPRRSVLFLNGENFPPFFWNSRIIPEFFTGVLGQFAVIAACSVTFRVFPEKIPKNSPKNCLKKISKKNIQNKISKKYS